MKRRGFLQLMLRAPARFIAAAAAPKPEMCTMMVTCNDRLSPDEVRRMREAFTQAHLGPWPKVVVLGPGVRVEEFPPVQQQLPFKEQP